jgi:hypothetical protein
MPQRCVRAGLLHGREETTMATPTDHNVTALELAKRAFTATAQAVHGSQRG